MLQGLVLTLDERLAVTKSKAPKIAIDYDGVVRFAIDKRLA